MLKVVLKYTDCLQDGKNVFSVLGRNKIPVIKSKRCFFDGTDVKLWCLFANMNTFSSVLQQLNQECSYEVSVVKYNIVKEK